MTIGLKVLLKISTARKFFVLMILFFGIGLSACAFKLRGHDAWSPALQVMFLQTEEPYGQLTATLANALRSSGVTLVNSPQKAKTILILSKPQWSNRATTIGSSNQTRIYYVTYSVEYRLADARGKIIVSPRPLSVTRSLTLSPNQLLEANNQRTQLEREMQRELIGQLLNMLSSKQIQQAVS